jgi:hypothetical protein
VNEKILFERELVSGSWEYQSVRAMANQDVTACLSPEGKNCAYIRNKEKKNRTAMEDQY